MVSRTKAKGRTARRAPPAKPAAAPVAKAAAETPPVAPPAEPAANAAEAAPVTAPEIDATAPETAAEQETAPEASTDTSEAPEGAGEAPAADAPGLTLTDGTLSTIQAEPDAPAAPDENIVEGFINGDTLIPIAHPDGGTIDGVETDADGNFLVRAIDAPTYFAHGFAVVDEQA